MKMIKKKEKKKKKKKEKKKEKKTEWGVKINELQHISYKAGSGQTRKISQ